MSAEGNGLTNMLLMPSNSVIVVVWQANRHTVALKVIYGNLAKLLGLVWSLFLSKATTCSAQIAAIN